MFAAPRAFQVRRRSARRSCDSDGRATPPGRSDRVRRPRWPARWPCPSPPSDRPRRGERKYSSDPGIFACAGSSRPHSAARSGARGSASARRRPHRPDGTRRVAGRNCAAAGSTGSPARRFCVQARCGTRGHPPTPPPGPGFRALRKRESSTPRCSPWPRSEPRAP